MTRVSDLYIELIPPNPLELQVKVAGAYESLTWSRGGVELAGSGSVSFSDFRQTLTVSSTSAGDAGEYTAAVSGSESVTFQVQEFSESTANVRSEHTPPKKLPLYLHAYIWYIWYLVLCVCCLKVLSPPALYM